MATDRKTVAMRFEPEFHAQVVMAAKVADQTLTDFVLEAVAYRVKHMAEDPGFDAAVRTIVADAQADVDELRRVAESFGAE